MIKINRIRFCIQKNYGPFDLKCMIAIFGLCFFIGSAEILSSPPFQSTPTIEIMTSNSKKADNICDQVECYRTAAELLSRIDPTVDPCDNFYKYACGGFMNKTILSTNQNSVDYLTGLGYNMRKGLRKSIEINKLNDPRTFRLMRTLYKACMNKVHREDRRFEPLHEVLNKLGGWPVIEGDSWNETAFDWVKVSHHIVEAGYDGYLINIYLHPDVKKNTRNRIYIVPSSFRNNSTAYFNYKIAIAKILGLDDNRMAELRDSLNFENELLRISEGGKSSELFKLMTIEKLSDMFPEIPWEDNLRNLLPTFIHYNNTEVVNVLFPTYFSHLGKLLARTPKRVVANYLIWRVIQDSVKFLNEDMRKIQYEHAPTLTGLPHRSPQWDECLSVVHDHLIIGTIALYVRNMYNQKVGKNVIEIIDHLKEELISTFRKVDWMDPQMLDKAVEKVKKMEHFVGYFDIFYDDEKLDKFYETLEVSEFDYFNSIRNVTRFDIRSNFKLFGKTTNRTDWRVLQKLFLPDPFSNLMGNGIIIPASSITNFVFNEHRPMYMNYGRIGYIISHEMFHGFESYGLLFNEYGNLFPWSTPAFERKFNAYASCIAKQYRNYTVAETGQALNAKKTVSEDIADNNGITIAYHAYNNWISRNAPEKQLPYIGKTPKQLFWLSYATLWCAKTTATYLSNYVKTDLHSPNEFRVIGPLSNSPDFANDWECPTNSNMNRVHKCSIL